MEIKGYVPRLYEHFAAGDLAIVQAGGTTTLELTALQKPFLYFPIEGHCEQELYVSARLARHKAGVKLLLSKTTPQQLAEKIIAAVGTKPDCVSIPIDVAGNAAALIQQLLRRG